MKNSNNPLEKYKNKGIVLFDGYCNLCSWSVQFVIKRDTKDYFRFVSLQSESAKQLLNQFSLPTSFDSSLVLIEHRSIYFKSDAALNIARKLRHLWPGLYFFIIMPKAIRDEMYSLIAKNRFKWFGKKDECYLPKKDVSYKFL